MDPILVKIKDLNWCDEYPVKEELESQFILRLPPEDAAKIGLYLKEKPKRIKKYVKIYLDPETRDALIIIRNKIIPMKLVDLPTIIESTKTFNKNVLFKTADISQILIPNYSEENNNEDTELNKEDKVNLWKHGVTPPLKNVRKQRFRRVLKNQQSMDSTEIEKELRWLLKMDNEAIAVRWQLIDDPEYKEKKKVEQYSQKEKDIFGDVITDSSGSDTEDFSKINTMNVL